MLVVAIDLLDAVESKSVRSTPSTEFGNITWVLNLTWTERFDFKGVNLGFLALRFCLLGCVFSSPLGFVLHRFLVGVTTGFPVRKLPTRSLDRWQQPLSAGVRDGIADWKRWRC
jgi:hypothetical protein